MIRKMYLKYGLLIPLAFLGIACTTDNSPNYSNNLETTLNITGNYRVQGIPKQDINNFTFTQTGSLVQGVDNKGTRYEGTSTGDIQTLSVTQGEDTFITTAITIQGTDSTGRVITIILTQANLIYGVPEGVTNVEVSEMPPQNTNVANPVAVAGLIGTYTDSAGLSGSIELVANVIHWSDNPST